MKTIVIAVAAAGVLATSGASLAQDTAKIGVLVGYTGPSALAGQQTDNAIKLFQQKFGDTPGGKKIEFVRRDTGGPNPEVVKRQVQELVTRDKVQILIGPDYTPNTLAAAPILTEAKVPSMVIGSATSGIVGEKSPYLTRTFFSLPQLCRPLAAYAFKNNLKKLHMMVADFAPGHDCERHFTAEFTAQGGTVTGNLRIPLSNPEFSSYMQRIKDAKPDGVFIFMTIGEMSLGSLRAVNDSGIKASGIKIIGTGDITDEAYLDAAGDGALDVITSGIYSTQHKSTMNQEFVRDYIAFHGKSQRIGWSAVAAWDAMRLIYDGLEAQKGSKFDPDKFMAFTRGRKFESPRGPVSIDKDNGDISLDVYIRRTARVDGVMNNVEIDTIPNVGFK